MGRLEIVDSHGKKVGKGPSPEAVFKRAGEIIREQRKQITSLTHSLEAALQHIAETEGKPWPPVPVNSDTDSDTAE